MDALMFADDLAIGRDQLSRGIRQGLTRLLKISINELGVIPTGDKADLLGIRLLGDLQAKLPRLRAHVGLLHVADREQRPAQLFLGQPKQEIALVPALIHAALQSPTLAGLVELDSRVVTSSNLLSANLPRLNQKRVKLQVIVAEAARNRRASGK